MRHLATSLLLTLLLTTLFVGCKRDRWAAQRAAEDAGRRPVAADPQPVPDPDPNTDSPAADNVVEHTHYHWTLQVAGPGHEQISACAAASGPALLVGGTFDKTLTLGGKTFTSRGAEDVFVARVGAEGNVLQAMHFGGPGADTITGIAETADGHVILAGAFEQTLAVGHQTLKGVAGRDGYVIRLDPTLAPVWLSAIGGTGDDELLDLATAGGHLAVAGYTTEGFDGVEPIGGRTDGFIARIDLETGAIGWRRAIGSTSSDKADAIDINDTGDLVATGHFKGQVQVGDQTIVGAGKRDIHVTAYGGDGEFLWGRALGGDDWDDAEVVRWAGQQVLVAGFAKGTLSTDEGPLQLPQRSAFAAVINAAGGALWVKAFAGEQPSAIKAVAVDQGDAVMIGEFQGMLNVGGEDLHSTSESIDVFVASYEQASGRHQWSTSLGGDGHEALHCGTRLGADVVVGGYFEGVLHLGSQRLESSSEHDGFIAAIIGREDVAGAH